MNKWDFNSLCQQSPFLFGIYVWGHWSLPTCLYQTAYFITNNAKHYGFLLFFPMARQRLLCLQTTSSRNWKWQLTIEKKDCSLFCQFFGNIRTEAKERHHSYAIYNLCKATVLFIHSYFFCEKRPTNISLTTECFQVTIVVIIKLQKCFMLITSFWDA
jgi:hypothetical protein